MAKVIKTKVRRGPYTRKGISDAKKVAQVAAPTKDVRDLSGIADTQPRHGGAHPQRGESKAVHGGVLNRKKTIDTCGMRYLKG